MYTQKKPSTSSLNQPPTSVPSDIQAKEKLILYVYDYLIQIGASKSANMFLNEIRWEKQVQIGLTEPPGFLLSWWCVFWDLYCAAPERRDSLPPSEYSNEAKAFHDNGFINSSGYQLPNMIPQQVVMDQTQQQQQSLPPQQGVPQQGAYFNGPLPPGTQSQYQSQQRYLPPSRANYPNHQQVVSPVPLPQAQSTQPPGVMNRLTPPTGNRIPVPPPPPPQYNSPTPQTPPQSRIVMSPAMQQQQQQRWPSTAYSSPSPAANYPPPLSQPGQPSTPIIQSPQDTDMNNPYGLVKQYPDHMISGNDMQQQHVQSSAANTMIMDDSSKIQKDDGQADFGHLMSDVTVGPDSDAIMKLKASMQEEAKRFEKNSNEDIYTDQ